MRKACNFFYVSSGWADKIATDRIIGSLVDFDAFPVMLFSYVIWFFLTCYEVVAVLGTRFHFASKIPLLTHKACLYIVQMISSDTGAQFQIINLGYKFCCLSLSSPLISHSDGCKIILKFIIKNQVTHSSYFLCLSIHFLSSLKSTLPSALFKPRGRHFNNKGQFGKGKRKRKRLARVLHFMFFIYQEYIFNYKNMEAKISEILRVF